MTSFGERVRGAIDRHGRLCVGIDPHPALLTEWGLTVDASGALAFGLRVIDAAAGACGIVKPQVSFFERYGQAGYAALEEVLATAREAGLIAIADVKRGDIGSTMDAYAEAWLGIGAPLEADAITVSPFLGVGALAGTLATAERHGKGVFVLAATSNGEAEAYQRATLQGGGTLCAGIVADVARHNAAVAEPGAWGSVGLVIGATVDWADAGLSAFSPPAPILAPGFGHQGAQPADLARYGEMAHAVIASESRSVLSAGPARLDERIAARAALYPAGGDGDR